MVAPLPMPRRRRSPPREDAHPLGRPHKHHGTYFLFERSLQSWFNYWLCSFYKYSTVEAFTALLHGSLPFQLHSWHRPRHQHLTCRHRRKRLQQKLLMVIHGKAKGAWDAVYQTARSQILDGLNVSPKSSNIFDRRFKHTTGGLLLLISR